MSPFVIDGLMHGLSLSERDAGLVGSVEFLTLAATAIAIAPVLPQLSCRRVGLVAVALALLADGASIFSASSASFALLRGFAGTGEGALYAVSLCVVACRSSNADRVYGYFQVVWALGSVALFSLGGELTAAFAYRGTLALIAGVTLALAPLLFFMPDASANNGKEAAADATDVLDHFLLFDPLPVRSRRRTRPPRALGRGRRICLPAGLRRRPATAGAVIGAGGYSSLAVVCVAITAAVWGLAMIVNRRLSRSARGSLAVSAGLEAAEQ